MSNLEQRFMEMAMSFFRRREKQFVELNVLECTDDDTAEGVRYYKAFIAKDFIAAVTPEDNPSCPTRIIMKDQSDLYVKENYDVVKAILLAVGD